MALIAFGAYYWRPAYWVDEYLTMTSVRLSWPDLFAKIDTRDPAPGPFYILLKPWSEISIDPAWMRIPIVLSAVVTVIVLAWFLNKAANAQLALITSALLVILPIESRYAHELRPYALAAMAAVIAVAFWWQATRPGGKRIWAVGYGVALALAGLFHLYSFTLIGALAVVSLVAPAQERWRRLRLTLVPGFVAAVALLPHVYFNLKNPTGSPNVRAVSLGTIRYIVERLFTPSAVYLWVAFAVLGAVIGVLSVALRELTLLALAWIAVPAVGLIAAQALLGMTTMVARYYFFAVPAVCILAAIPLAAVWKVTWMRVVVVVALIGLLVWMWPRHLNIRQEDGHNRSLALGKVIESPALEGVPIVVTNNASIRLTHSTTYPRVRLSEEVPANAPILGVVTRSPYGVTMNKELLAEDGPYTVRVRCKIPAVTFRVITLTEGGPDKDWAALAQELDEAGGSDARCVVE